MAEQPPPICMACPRDIGRRVVGVAPDCPGRIGIERVELVSTTDRGVDERVISGGEYCGRDEQHWRPPVDAPQTTDDRIVEDTTEEGNGTRFVKRAIGHPALLARVFGPPPAGLPDPPAPESGGTGRPNLELIPGEGVSIAQIKLDLIVVEGLIKNMGMRALFTALQERQAVVAAALAGSSVTDGPAAAMQTALRQEANALNDAVLQAQIFQARITAYRLGL